MSVNNFLNMIRGLRPERYILPAAGATAVGYSLMNSYYTVEGGHRCVSPRAREGERIRPHSRRARSRRRKPAAA